MITAPAAALERRVLVHAPTSRDTGVTVRLLTTAGIEATPCESLAVVLDELDRGAAAVLLSEESLGVPDDRARLLDVLGTQPIWSDLPLLVVTRGGERLMSAEEAVRALGNVTVLERPVRKATLVSAVRTALRARERQLHTRELLREREVAERALREADQRKDEFLATLGHELRNPLAPLVTGLHLLSVAPDAARVGPVTTVMTRQLQHLVRLVDDLMEVSRITRGLVTIQREPLDLAVAVRAAVDSSRPMLDAAGHTLHIEMEPGPLTVTGDSIRLTQVFANLLTNAAKYTNAGGTIWLRVERDGQRVRVSVRDTGIGIQAAQLESVFDMFMQVDRSNRRAQGGLGIGLTLVRSLVALHGGHVYAHSEGPGRGSEFVVELPLRTAVAATAGDRPAPPPFPARRILVVDDNVDAADTLGALLGALGSTVAVSHSGPEALDQMTTFAPDAVVLDIGMPGMDGYEVARRIRAAHDRDEVTLVALTGWGQDADLRQAREAGFDHHLVKPPDLERLRQALARDWPRASSGPSMPNGSGPSAPA